MNTPNYLVATSLLMLSAVTAPVPNDVRFARNQMGLARLDTRAFSLAPAASRSFLAHHADHKHAPEHHAHHPYHLKPIHG